MTSSMTDRSEDGRLTQPPGNLFEKLLLILLTLGIYLC